jgi:hypothetical protein
MWLLLPPPSLWIHVLQRLALPIGAEMAQLSNLSTFLYLAFLFWRPMSRAWRPRTGTPPRILSVSLHTTSHAFRYVFLKHNFKLLNCETGWQSITVNRPKNPRAYILPVKATICGVKTHSLRQCSDQESFPMRQWNRRGPAPARRCQSADATGAVKAT